MDRRAYNSISNNWTTQNPHSPVHTMAYRASDPYAHMRSNVPQSQHTPSMHIESFNGYHFDPKVSPPSHYARQPMPQSNAVNRQPYPNYTPQTYQPSMDHSRAAPQYLQTQPQYLSQGQPEEVSYPASPLRPFSCDMCALSFNRQHDLKRHRETHSGDKPFPCEACGKSFTRKDALKRHQTVKKCGPMKPE